MALFSQRKGITPFQKSIQIESVDEDLRNSLWSALQMLVWDQWEGHPEYGYQSDGSAKVESLLISFWLHYFKRPIDTMPSFRTNGRTDSGYQILRVHFFKAEWWKVYDFIEFILKNIEPSWRPMLKEMLNGFLQRENAAYRIIDNEVVPISDPQEIEAIESAIDQGMSSVRKHLQKSLEMLSDRKTPDYRNAIKEAISGVESACQTVSGKHNGTLPDCLKALKDKKPFHPAFEVALGKLYAFTSDEGGIRHALSEDATPPTYADAKFMLVASSAFVNYLWTKVAELDIKLKPPS